MAKVERDQQCQSVIKQRMAEGLIPKARLCDDVALFKGQEDPDALGVIGGFPCQVMASLSNWQCSYFVPVLNDFCGWVGSDYIDFVAKDISVAGEQLGMEGERSSMVRHPFRVYDELRNPKKRSSQ